MQLLKTLFVFSLCSVYAATSKEVCISETFNASCSAGEVVSIESAFYGRMHNNRCFNLTDNETPCSADVRFDIQKQFGVKGNLHFKPNSDLFKSITTACLEQGMPFLEISYQCTKSISNEICIEETFNATCPSGTVIFIQSALYGRMRSSRCTDFIDSELNCYANVQPYISSVCKESIECTIKVVNDDTLRHAIGSCKTSLKPYLEVFYTCAHAISNEICIEETFNATCPSGTVIFVQSALYGRMRSSRCTDFIDTELNCYANVQPYISSVCKKSTECTIKVVNDDTLRHAIGSCKTSLKPYLEVFYTCVHDVSCPQLSLPKGATMEIIDNSYHLMCNNKTQELFCKYGKWNIDPVERCGAKDQLYLLAFSIAAGVFLLTAIIAVVVCLQRIQKNSRRNKTNRPRRQAEDEYNDYPESHLRRQHATCGSENEYEYEYEYEYDGQQDDGTYGSYSHVRNTGP